MTSAMPPGIYLHIPFCRSRCPYCDFVSNAIDGPVPNEFVEALCREITTCRGPARAATVFLGGGTPSLLRPTSLERIFEALRSRFEFADNVEITIEANPDDISLELVSAWKAIGITRVSLGVQSFDDAVLRYLGRRHDAEAAYGGARLIADRFEHWSMDLIFGAPPVSSWPATLDSAVDLAPPHLSAYGLTYEPGTAFAERAHEAVDEDTALDLYRCTHGRLVEAGYDHYEISNFARHGHQCRHNLVYWHNEEYLGFGPGAYSYIDEVRSRTTPRLGDYLATPGLRVEEYRLSGREIRQETVIQHFRLASGLPVAAYRDRFGCDVEDDFGPALATLVARGLLDRSGHAYIPTRKGFELNNEIGLAIVD